MKFNAKKLVSALICMIAGTLGLIFMGLSHMDYLSFFGSSSISGFDYITSQLYFYEFDFLKIIDMVLLIMMIVLPSVIILLGLINFIGALAGKLGFFKKCGAAFRVLTSVIITVYTFVTVGSFACVLLLTIFDPYTSMNFAVGLGAYMLMCFAAVEWIALLVFNSLAKKSDREQGADFVCGSCGKEYDVFHKFCPNCGGTVTKKYVAAPAGAVCSGCGHVGSANDRFCSVCGGDLSRPTFCAACGRPAGAGEKFCPACGSAIVHQ